MPLNRHHPRTWFLCALLLAVPARPIAAQGYSANISGTVVDEVDRVVPGATISLIDEGTRQTRVATSNETGEFAFNALQPGTYTVRVELLGFRTYERTNNILSASDQLSVGPVVLPVGELSETITVVADGSQVDRQNSDHSALLTSTQIEQIQTKGRDVMSLLRLLPGVRYEDDIEAMGDSPGSPVPNIGGQRRHWNNITVDGLLGNGVSGSSRFSAAISIDAIAEVKVLLNTYKAEFGRSGGANVQIVTKSGTARYSGTSYYYKRHEGWNANSWENNRNGVAKPRYRYDTFGFNIGGPVRIPKLGSDTDKKLFFFYSLDAPQVEKPGSLRRFRMPTELERRGDFSQTFDTAGRLIVIRDPLTRRPFPNNSIPSDRIDPNGLALLKLLPMPNRPELPVTSTYNFVRQETTVNPRVNNVLKLDWRRTPNDSLWVMGRLWYSDQRGSEITAGPAKWGFFNAHYTFRDNGFAAGHTHIFGRNVVNETFGGVRFVAEAFPPVADADWRRLRRADVGFNVAQFHPELNPLGVIPRATFGLSGGTSPDITFDTRLPMHARDWVLQFKDNLTWSKNRHTIKSGVAVEYLKNHEARNGLWMGEIDFRRNINNPLDTQFAFSNAVLGVFDEYTETDAFRELQAKGVMAEWYLQDTWRPDPRLTVDYGMRFLWFTPWWQATDRAAVFVPARYDPAKAPRLYWPAIVDGRRVAYDADTGQILGPAYIGTYVVGSGDLANGIVTATDPDYPKGFRDRLPPQPEPRVGVAYDLSSTGTTVLHASAGMFHNARLAAGMPLSNLYSNPPIVHQPSIFYGSLSTLVEPGARLAMRPVSVAGLERHAKAPSSYNWSIGVRRDLRWGTAADITYVGALGRHLEMQRNINAVPDGARYLDLHPENLDPSTGRAVPAEFLRPYRGYQAITIRENSGTSNYQALQVNVFRRYSKGLQFSAAYTYARAFGVGDDDPSAIDIQRPYRAWHYSPLRHNQRHNLVINYTWDLPRATSLWSAHLIRALFDHWQLSGENAFVDGDWDDIDLTTTDVFDFDGGDGGQRAVMTGVPELPRRKRDALTQWFNTAAFARPSGRGDFGNTPRLVFRQPGVNNWNLSLFKNVPLGGRRRFQIRWEMYNVLNKTQFREVNNDARFDPDGLQTNQEFGRAIRARNPRVMQASLRFNF